MLADVLARARAGSASALVVHGEAGVGKSVLVEGAVAEAAAAGMRVLRCHGMESESPLAFAGLHQLLRPLLPGLERLPAPQARALRVAFGQEEGAAVDPFLNALATLGLLSDAAAEQPLLVVVDDAHWLDDASTDALTFTARRLEADAAAVLFTARDGDRRSFAADGIPRLELTGLDEAAARSLLAEALGADVPDEVVRELLDQTGGNPLALVELPTALSVEQLSGAAPLPARLQLTERVERVFLDRCRRLPADVQTLLLVTAADDTREVDVVARAAAALDVEDPHDALRRAVEARLLEVEGDVVRVRHPLVRSATYQAATAKERRTAHRALAAALEGSADRQAWHLAAAAEGTDDVVALALDEAAARAERAGGHAAATAAYERSAALTGGDPLRAQRLFAAARNAWAAGQVGRAATLADQAKAVADDRLLRADLDRLRARIEINTGSAATAHHIFLAAARSVAADDPVRALEMRVAATLTHQYSNDIPADIPADVPDDIGSWEGDEGLPGDARTQCLRHLLAATTADGRGDFTTALPALARAVELTGELDDPDVVANVGNAALHLGDDEGHRRCFTRMLAGARDRAAVMSVLYALPRLAFGELVAGRWDRVRDSAAEARSLALATGQPSLAVTPLAWLALLAALRGQQEHEDLGAELDRAQQQHLGVLADPVRDLSRWAAGVSAARAGDVADALHHLSGMRVGPLVRMAAYDRLDAAVRADDLPLAEQWTKELSAFAADTGWAWACAAAAYGRAVTGDAESFAEAFEESLRHHGTADRPYEKARAHLAYGELLRRSQRRVDARPHLRAAHAVFQDLRADPDASRAAEELRASGETARKRDPSTLTDLTPMELKVASLVSQGLSNKDVATQLWISPRTVAFHLRGAFAKLGISSRGELAQHLG